MGRALANFRELAAQEVREPQMVQILEKFEREQSDIILRNLESSLQFVRFVADVTYLFFPAMFDTVLGTSGTYPETNAEQEKDETNDPPPPPRNSGPDTPDQGDSNTPPGADGPEQV